MDERAGNDGRLPSHSRTVGIVGLPPHARCCRRLIALSLRHLQLPDDQPSHRDLRQGDGKMAFALFGTGLLMELIGLMELKIDQLNKVNYGNAIPIFIIIRTRKLQFCRSLIRQRPSPSRIPEFASSNLTMEPPFASEYFPTSSSRSPAQSNSPLGFAASHSDERGIIPVPSRPAAALLEGTIIPDHRFA